MRAASGRPSPRHPFRMGGMGIPQGFDLIVWKLTRAARSQGARTHPISRSRLFVMVTRHSGHDLADFKSRPGTGAASAVGVSGIAASDRVPAVQQYQKEPEIGLAQPAVIGAQGV